MQRHQITRVRHDTRRRLLTVTEIEQLTPNMRRLVFASDDLEGFVSAGFDDHVKLFFPSADVPGERPCMRDFTPRRFDVAQGSLTIDFALHDAGPATSWAAAATVGDTLAIGGPRGSAIVPDDFDWVVLIGDETALPAIGRRLEELRAGLPVTGFVLLDDPADRQEIATRTQWTPTWVVRVPGTPDAETMLRALAGFTLPPGDGYIWIAAETGIARTLRAHFVDQLGHRREWIKAAGYWTRGEADVHERIE